MVHIKHVERFLNDFSEFFDRPVDNMLNLAREFAKVNDGYFSHSEVSAVLGKINSGALLAHLVQTDKDYIQLSAEAIQQVRVVRGG